MKKYFTYLTLLLTIFLSAQQPTDFTTAALDMIISSSSAAEGNIYHDTDLDIYYIGLTNGTLKAIGNIVLNGANDADVLRWNTTLNSWEVVAENTNTLTLTKVMVNSVKRARIRLEPAFNVNTAGYVVTPDIVEINETNLTASTTGVISGLEGDLRFEVQANFISNTLRTNINCVLRVNGVVQKRISGHNYIRDDSGHNNSSSNWIFEWDGALSADTFELILEQEANGGNGVDVQLVSDVVHSSYIFIEETSTVEVVTNITAPLDQTMVQGPVGDQGLVGNQGPQGLPGAVINSPLEVYHASGNINALGVPNYIIGATVLRTDVGRYTVSFLTPFPDGDDYPVLFSMEQNPGADDYVPTYLNANANGFDVEIGEQDNGGTGGVFRDAGFSFFIPLGDITPGGTGGSGGLTPTGTLTTTGFNLTSLNDTGYTSPFSFGFNGPNPSVANNYEVFFDNIPYQINLAGLSQTNPHTVTFNDNGDGTYDYLFTSTVPIAGNSGFVMISSLSPPFGTLGTGTGCGCVSFYLLP